MFCYGILHTFWPPNRISPNRLFVGAVRVGHLPEQLHGSGDRHVDCQAQRWPAAIGGGYGRIVSRPQEKYERLQDFSNGRGVQMPYCLLPSRDSNTPFRLGEFRSFKTSQSAPPRILDLNPQVQHNPHDQVTEL